MIDHDRKFTIGMALVAAALFAVAYTGAGCTPKGKQIVSDIGACVAPIAPDLYRLVAGILLTGGADWQAALEQLPQGIGAVICAVKMVVADLRSVAARTVHGQVDPQMSGGIARGERFLAGHGVR